MLELNQTSSLLLERIAAKISKVGDEAPDWMMATLISPHLAVTQAESFLLRGNATSGLRLNFDARRDLPLEIGASLAEIDAQRYFAVLRLQPNFSIPLPQLIFGNEDPPSGAAWHSLIITSSTPKGLPVSGTVAGIREIDGDRYLELLSSQPLEPHAIGAPVVVGDRLVGILNQPVNDRQWRAIPVSSLLESQKTELVYETWLYQRLSVSSRRALSHADGIRRALGLEEVRMEHLIAGSFEKKSGAMRRVLTGQGIDGNRLNQMLAEISQRDFPAQGQYTATKLSALPPISPQVRQALRKAREMADAQGSEIITSGYLGYGAFSVEDCDTIRAMQAQGVNRESFLSDEPADSEGPSRIRLIAGYRSDDPTRGEDLLGISREVEALCAVIASKDVEPPISLGLFGDWGSGKSFFMRQMEARIKALSAAESSPPDPASPYCSKVVQLWFNAWHYIDTELWASLADEIFKELAQALVARQAIRENQSDPNYERALLLAQCVNAKEELEKQKQAQLRLKEKLNDAKEGLATLDRKEPLTAISPRKVFDEAYRLAAQQQEVKEGIEKAEEEFDDQIEKAAEQLQLDSDEMKAQLRGAHRLGRLAYMVWLAIRNPKVRWGKIVLIALPTFLLVFLVFPFINLWLSWEWLNSLWLRGFLIVLGPLSALLRDVAPYLRYARRALSILNEVIARTRKSQKAEQQEQRRELQERQRRWQRELIETQQSIAEKSDAVVKIEQQLQNLRADRQIANFIKQRSASTDYTKYHGVIARVRADFEQLSSLLESERRQVAQGTRQPGGDQEPLLPQIDRIILYIDDLDRCPEEKVVQVLQAVHLLLAFPLFVVVVGADPRWLLHSLKLHSRAFQDGAVEVDGLSDEESTHWRSTPLNYLEKIFQIPFTLRPMPKVGFEGLIDHLAAAPVGSTPADSTNAEPDGTEVVSVEASISTPQTRDGFEREVLPKVGVAQSEPSVKSKGAVVTPPKIASEHLRIEEWEREVMKRLFGLIPSPRAAKRFVNIYRLLRASVPDEQREAFIGDEEHGTHREVLLLLAILVGFPSEATDIMRALLEREPTESWWDFIEGFRAKSNGTGPGANSKQAAELDRRQELLKKLDQVRDLIPETERCDHFIQWAWEVARFSFQSGRIVRGQEQGDSPLRNGF